MKIDFNKLPLTKDQEMHKSQEKIQQILDYSFQNIISLRQSRKRNKSFTMDTQDKSKNYVKDTELLLKLFDQSFSKRSDRKIIGLKDKRQNIPSAKIIKEINQSIFNRNKQQKLKQIPRIKNTHTQYKHIESKYTTTRTQRPLITKREAVTQRTFQPQLNYTMKSKINNKVMKKRKVYFQEKKTTVFQSLHSDAKRYQAKRYLQQIIEKQKSKAQKTQIFKANNKKNKKFETFQKRLEKSIQKYGENKKLNEKYHNVDLTTGKKLFEPNLKQSRISYEKVFKQAMDQFPIKKMNNFQVSRSLQKLSQKQPSTTMRVKNCSSVEKINQLKKSTTTEQIMNSLETAIVSRYVQMFYDKNTLFFQRRYNQISTLSHAEYNILQEFFTYIQYLQKTQNVSKHAFDAYFRKFYRKLNLYDVQILRDCFQIDKKIKDILRSSSKSRKEIQIQEQQNVQIVQKCKKYPSHIRQLNYI